MVDKKATLDVVEEAMDVMEETLDTIERIPKLRLNGTTRKQQIIILAFTATVSAVASGSAVYFGLNKKLKTKYEKIADAEIEKGIAEAKEYYHRLSKTEGYSDPEELAKAAGLMEDELIVTEDPRALAGEVERLNYASSEAIQSEKDRIESKQSVAGASERVAEVLDEAATEIHNVFTKPAKEPDFDYEAEIARRSESEPYIIHEDEFDANELNYEQKSLKFYQEDEVLTDDRDEVIPESDSLVGDGNLLRFGHGAKRSNYVHVRNERLDMDFEIVQVEGSYTKEVLGLEPILEHSERRGSNRREHYGRRNGGPRKFRPGDDE